MNELVKTAELLRTEALKGLDLLTAGSIFGQYIIGFILTLFLLSCLMLLRNIWQVSRERRVLNQTRKKFLEAVETQQSIGQVVEELLKVIPKSIVYRRINTLFSIRQIHSISTDLLERMDDLEEQRRYSFIRFVTNVLLILGLLGTVFGLSIAVQNIVPAIRDAQNLADVTTLATALSQTMGGLHTAFNTTLVALSSTFLLALFVHLAQRYERTFIHELEYFTTYELMPRILISAEAEANTLYVEAIEKSAIDIAKAADVLDQSREGIQAIVTGLVRATNVSEGRIVDFFNFAQSFQDSVAQLMGYKDDIQKTYTNIEGVLREIKDSQLTDKMIGEIVDKSVARSMAATQEVTETVRETFKADIKALEEGQSQYLEGIKATKSAIENFSKQSATDLSQAITESFEQSLVVLRDEIKEVAKREDISRMIAADVTNNFRKLVTESLGANQKTQKSFEGLIDTLREIHIDKNKNTPATTEPKLSADLTTITQ